MGPALVVMYTYQGAITSTFAADKLKPLIETMEELNDNTAVQPSTLRNSFPFACLEVRNRINSLRNSVLNSMGCVQDQALPFNNNYY